MAKPRRKSTTAALRWTDANTLIKGLMADRRYNTVLLIGAGIYFVFRIGGHPPAPVESNPLGSVRH